MFKTIKRICLTVVIGISLALSPIPALAADLVTDLKEALTEVESPIHFLNAEYAGTLSTLTFITPKAAYMNLYSGISVSDYIKMANDFIKLRDYTDIRDVVININSPGGSAFDGLSISDLIDRMEAPPNDFSITAVASGIIASAAVPIYAACNIRTVTDGAMFMVHEVSLWKRGSETASDIVTQGQMIEKLQYRYATILANNSTVTVADWLLKMKLTTWFTKAEAYQFGLIERVTGGDYNSER